jgi:hypothetical protein
MKLLMKQSMTYFAMAMALILIFMTGCGNEVVPQFAIDCMDQNNMDPDTLNVSMQPLTTCLEDCMDDIPLDLEACYNSDCEVPYLTGLEPVAVAVVDCIGGYIEEPVNQIELQMIYLEISTRLHTAFQVSYATAYDTYAGQESITILEDAYITISADLADKLFAGLEDGQGGMVFSGLQNLFSAQFGAAAGLSLYPLVPPGTFL